MEIKHKTQKLITLDSWNQVDILKQIEKNKPHFILNNQLAKNIDIIIKYSIHKQYQSIKILHSNDQIDQLCFHIFSKFLKQNYKEITKQIKLKLENFTEKELFELLGLRNYQLYCSQNNKKPAWDKDYLQTQIRKLEKNNKFEKYFEFKMLKQRFKEFPFSHFNFPKEQDKDRFVYYFNIYSNGSKKDMLGLITDLNLDKRIKKFVDSDEINDKIAVYALGFSYKENKLIRLTFYSSFSNPFDVEENKLFLQNKHNLIIKEDMKNIWTYAIDLYEDHEEFKVYEESFNFNLQLQDEVLNNVLHNKISTKVLKIKDNKLKSTKYEFQIKKFFTEYEKTLLQCSSDILALYIHEGEVIKRVEYDV